MDDSTGAGREGGAQLLEVLIFAARAFPNDLLAPVLVLLDRDENSTETNPSLRVDFFVHPAVFQTVSAAIRESVRCSSVDGSISLAASRRHRHGRVYQLVGPSALELLRKTLKLEAAAEWQGGTVQRVQFRDNSVQVGFVHSLASDTTTTAPVQRRLYVIVGNEASEGESKPSALPKYNAVWQAIVYAGARAVGLDEMMSIYTTLGRLPCTVGNDSSCVESSFPSAR